MTQDEIRNLVNKITSKDDSGKTLTTVEWNAISEAVNIELFNKKYDELVQAEAQSDVPLYQRLYNSSALNEFKTGSSLIITAGVATLPSNYRYYTGVAAQVDTLRQGMEIIGDQEFENMISNVLMDDPAEFPKGNIYGSSMRVVPKSISHVYLNYLKEPDVPFYDSCLQTTTNLEIYMPVGSYITGTTLYTASGDVIAVNVVHTSSHTTSTSVEFEWRADSHVEIAKMIADKVLQAQQNTEGYQLNVAEKQDS